MIQVSWALFETIVLKKLGVAMKVIFGLLVSLSVMLSGCGGGGSSGGTTTSSTFNLAQGLANFAKTGSTNTFNISGTCAGKFLFVIDPATSTSTPEGDTKFVAKTTTNFTFNAPCSFGGGAGTPRTQAKVLVRFPKTKITCRLVPITAPMTSLERNLFHQRVCV